MDRVVETPECPRCGYDLRGGVAAWRDSCPLDGVCPECGLRYEWRDVFKPERLSPRWSFEHGRDRLVWRWVSTVARTLRPGTFWKRMRVESPVRVGRLVVMALAVVAVAHVLIAVMWGTIGYAQSRVGWRAGWLGIVEPWDSTLSLAINPYRSASAGAPEPLSIMMMIVAGWGCGAGLPFLCLGPSLRLARVRRAHVLRAWACFVPTVAALVLCSGAFWTLHAHVLAAGWGGWWMWRAQAWLVVMALPVAAWFWWWWRCFVSQYLRLSRPGLTSGLMLTVSGLCALAVAAYMPGTRIYEKLAWQWFMLTR